MSTSRALRNGLSNGSWIATVLLLVIFAIYASTAEHVFTAFSMNNLVNNTMATAIAAIGLSMVVLIGGFDLSVAGVVVLANVIVATHGGQGVGGVLSNLFLVILAGGIVGALNGLFVAYVGVQSIAVTLATMIMCQGLAVIVMPAPGGSVPAELSALTELIGDTIPVGAIILAIFIIGWILLKRTEFGVFMYAIGADERAAVQAGIPVRRVKFFTYVLAGVIYGLAGFMLSAQTASGDPSGSTLFLMLVFAAVAIGGTSFGGGKGSAIGSLIGAGILTLLQKMLFALGVSTFYTNIFQGVVLIVAVLIGGLSIVLAKRGES